MAIYRLYTDENEQNEEEEVGEEVSRPSFWRSMGLRFAFLFAVCFCMMWFFWVCGALAGWTLVGWSRSRKCFLAKKKQAHYTKSLHLTSISFLGCLLATFSPYMGLSFLLAYFGVFSDEFQKEGIILDELIDKVKRLSA